MGSITIDHDNVTSTVTLEYTEGFEPQEELTFVFKDKPYQGGGEWHAESPYTATCTVADLANGTAVLNFTTTVDLPWREIPLDGINVDIQRIMGRYPKQIYNTGANDGTESVSVSYNGQPLSRNVTIDRTSVHSGYITLAEGAFDATGTLTFTFEDAYWSYKNGFGWSDEKGYGATTYTASYTIQELLDGTADLYFETNLNGITLPGNNKITVQQETISVEYRDWQNKKQTATTEVYPEKLHNNQQETVSISYDNQAIAEINMDENSFVIEDNFFVPLPDNASGNITFTFTDNYCTSANYEYDYWWSRWSDFYFSNEETPYTARATVEALKAGTAQLNFER